MIAVLTSIIIRGYNYLINVIQDSSRGIATGYGLDAWGSIPGRDNIILSISYMESIQPPIQMFTRAHSRLIRLLGRVADHS
jgi:hypothetical protein